MLHLLQNILGHLASRDLLPLSSDVSLEFNQFRFLIVLGNKQDACTGVHSVCRREENGHNLDIWVLRLREGQMQIFLCLKVGKGFDFQRWDLNRAHES